MYFEVLSLKNDLIIFPYFPCINQLAAFQKHGSNGVSVDHLIFEDRLQDIYIVSFWIFKKGNGFFFCCIFLLHCLKVSILLLPTLMFFNIC